MRILNDEPPSLGAVPGVPDWLAKLVSQLLRKNSDERPQTATEVLRSLDAGPTAPMRRWSPRQWFSELKGRRVLRVLVGIGVLAAAPGLGWYFLLRDGERRGAAARSSIAVLPFVNMSSNQESEYFSDGMTEELINALASVDGLRVVSRTSAFAFKGKNLSIQKIGQELNVGTVVEGSVRREGERLRIAAQLVNVADGYHLWSKTYERELKNIFAVEDELARSIVQALKPKLIGSQSAPLVKPPTSSLEAHDLYLQGRYFKEKRSAEGLRTAAGFFAQATEKDPAYALAWVGLADATALLAEYARVPPSSVLPKARQSALRALELDPQLAEAHATLGLIAQFSFQWAEAEAALRKAIELNPRYPTAHQWYALLLDYQGRIPEGYAETDRAYRLDPTSLIINHLVATTRLHARDYDGAVEAFKRTLEMAPDTGFSHTGLGVAYAAQGKYSEALAEYDKAPKSSEYFHGLTYVLAGRPADARRLVEEMEQRAKREYVSPAARGLTWIALGEKDRGYALLAKACAETDRWLHEAKVNPLFDSLRAEPRFHEVLKCIHLE
jgi:serine/threonine-protein kinase